MDGKQLRNRIEAGLDAVQQVTDKVRATQERNGNSIFGRVWDAVAGSIGHAVTDIRQKVVEEPWFGRAVTPELVSEVKPAEQEKPTGGIHGPSRQEPESGIHGSPVPLSPPPRGPEARREAEALFETTRASGKSFAEAIAERHGWAKEYHAMQKEIGLAKKAGQEPPAPGEQIDR